MISIAGVQTNSLAMVLQRPIRLGGSGSLQAISFFRQISRRKSLNLTMNAAIKPAGSNIGATVDRTTALVQSNVSLRSKLSRRSRGPLYAPFFPFFPRKTFGEKVKVSCTGSHL